MKTTILAAGLLIAFVAGCTSKKPATSGATNSSSGDPVLGAVQNVRGAAQRMVTSHDLDSLRIFIDNASGASGQMPKKELIVSEVKKADPKLGKLLEDGGIVLPGATQREGVWAYEKDAPTRGGMVLTSSGIERLTAEELKQRLTQTN